MTVSAPITIADLPETLRGRYLADDSRLRVEVIPAEDISDNDALRHFVEAVLSVAPQATDTPVVVLKAGDAVIHRSEEQTSELQSLMRNSYAVFCLKKKKKKYKEKINKTTTNIKIEIQTK